jgi:hypothetical protein
LIEAPVSLECRCFYQYAQTCAEKQGMCFEKRVLFFIERLG